MNNFFFRNPTKIIFGKEMLGNLPKEINVYGNSTLIVYGGKSIKKNGLLNKVKKILKSNKIFVYELPGVIPNPIISTVKKGINLVKKKKIKSILAIGGGSVIDTGKIIAAGAMVNHDPWNFFNGKSTVKSGLPLIAIQTLSGSAAEVTSGATITNEKTNQKLGAGGFSLYPKVAFLDPENTFSVPKNHTAYGAVDMISHLLDPYFFGKKEKNLIPSILSKTLIKIIIKITPKVISNPKNYHLRADLMWSAVLANNGILSRGLNPARYYLHMIEHSISGLYKDVSHGAGLSVVILGWIRYQMIHMHKFLSKLGLIVFDLNKKKKSKDLAIKTEKKFYNWLKLIKCPTKLSQLGINKKDFNKIIENIIYEIENELKYLDKKTLKKFINLNYPEKKLLTNKKQILKFERQRLFKILSLCE